MRLSSQLLLDINIFPPLDAGESLSFLVALSFAIEIRVLFLQLSWIRADRASRGAWGSCFFNLPLLSRSRKCQEGLAIPLLRERAKHLKGLVPDRVFSGAIVSVRRLLTVFTLLTVTRPSLFRSIGSTSERKRDAD